MPLANITFETKNNITLLPLTLQVVFFDFLEVDFQSYIFQNQILLSFILYIYKPRKGKFLSHLWCLLKQINKVRRMNGWVTRFPLCENKRIWFYVKFSFNFHFSPFWGNFFMVLPGIFQGFLFLAPIYHIDVAIDCAT